jgi:hypothetical protein
MSSLFIALAILSNLPPRPIVWWVSEPVLPNQTVLLFGDNFDGVSTALFRQGKRRIEVRCLQTRPHSVKAVVPASFEPGTFDVTVRGSTVPVNRPKILWVQGDAVPGGTIRVFGTALSWPKSSSFATLSGARRFRVPCQARNPFSLSLRLPSSMKPGRYEMRLSGGAPLTLDVSAMRRRLSYKVSVASFGASGSDGLDETASVLRAIRDASAHGGGTVLFPRGRFVLNRGLQVPPGVDLQGAGEDLTALCWPDSETPPPALIQGTHDFGVQDLTLYAVNHGHGIVCDQGPSAGGGVCIQRVRMRLDPYRGHLTEAEVAKRLTAQQRSSTGGADCLRLGGPNVRVLDCDVSGGGRSIYLSGARNSVVARNRFANGRWGWYCISGSDGLIFEDNVITSADLMSTGGGLNCLDGSMVSRNVYFARNRIGECPGWDREAMTTDAGGGAYYGAVASSNGRELVPAADPNWNGRDWRGAAVFVLSGPGQGQFRQIQRTEGRRIELDRPWAVRPGPRSVITVTMLQQNYLFVENTMDESGVAIQLYGTAIGTIAYGNVSRRTDGFHNFGMNYYGVQPSWFTQWLNNRIEAGNVYGGGHDQSVSVGEAHLGAFALDPGVTPKAPVTLCSIIRDNRLDSNSHLGLGGSPDSPYAGFPFVEEAVVEGNRVRAASCGLVLSPTGVSGAVIRNNDFKSCIEDVVYEPAESASRRVRLRNLLRAGNGLLMRLPLSRNLEDTSGHGFDGLAEGPGAMIVSDPEKGACLELDGSSRCSVIGSDLLNLDTFTLSLWLKPERLAGRYGFVSKRNANGVSPFVVGSMGDRLFFEATDHIGLWSFQCQSGAVLKAGVWQHLVVVRELHKGVTLYLDGKRVAHSDNTLATSPNDEPIEIGWEAWGGESSKGTEPTWFRGRISDVELHSQPMPPPGA